MKIPLTKNVKKMFTDLSGRTSRILLLHNTTNNTQNCPTAHTGNAETKTALVLYRENITDALVYTQVSTGNWNKQPRKKLKKWRMAEASKQKSAYHQFFLE